MSTNTKEQRSCDKLADLVFAAKVDDENEQFLGEKWHKDAEQALAAHEESLRDDAEQVKASEPEYVRRREQEAAFKDGWQAAQAVPAYTEGHCKEKAKPGGCQLHNLQCGYPACDRKTVPAAPAPEAPTPLGVLRDMHDNPGRFTTLAPQAQAAGQEPGPGIDTLAAVSAALAQRQPLAEWLPIETAPKDGTLLLLWEKYESEPFIGSWYAFRSEWEASRTYYDADGNACVVDRVYSPGVTHWMPLPAAPGATTGEQQR